MDVVDPYMDSTAMVNEDPRVVNPYSAYGPIFMLTVYGLTNGFREYQKDVGDC